MPWFKVDDKHHDHRKTRRALRGGAKRRDAAAVGLWCLAGSWSADNLMDGFVPTDELLRWDDDGEELAAALVDAEFWEPAIRDDEPGFRFINWDEHQPTKADVEAKREAARERMRAARSKGGKTSSREQVANVRTNEHANFARTSHEVRSTPVRSTPSRPDPTRPDPEEHLLVDESTDLNRFDEFWDTYGKKVKRADAEKRWAKAVRKESADRIISAAAAYVAHERANNEGGRFIADPSTWLHGERWRDERSDLPRPQAHQGRAAQWLQLAADLGEPTPHQNIREIGTGR